MHSNSPAGTIPVQQQPDPYWHQCINQQALPFTDRAGRKQILVFQQNPALRRRRRKRTDSLITKLKEKIANRSARTTVADKPERKPQHEHFLPCHGHLLRYLCRGKRPFKYRKNKGYKNCLKLLSLKKKNKACHKKANMLTSQLLQSTASKSTRTAEMKTQHRCQKSSYTDILPDTLPLETPLFQLAKQPAKQIQGQKTDTHEHQLIT